MNQYIITSNCIGIKGAQRSVMYDLIKMKFEFIPNALSDFLEIVKKQKNQTLLLNSSEEQRIILNEYLTFCADSEYILEIPEKVSQNCFPSLNLEFEVPSVISNICINLKNESLDYLIKLKEILLITKCHNVQIICEPNFNLENIINNIAILSEIGLESIELIVPFEINFNYVNIVDKHKNVSFVFVYNAPTDEFIKHSFYGLQQVLYSTKSFQLTDKKSFDFFNIHISLFTESQKHNTYFNRKLYIGVNGEIKNAPESIDIFGNINTIKSIDEILTIVDSPKFQKYWYIHKGLIDICKQCEFRHMCVDNREPIKRNGKEWYFETECNYNPYIAKWQSEEGYKTLSE